MIKKNMITGGVRWSRVRSYPRVNNIRRYVYVALMHIPKENHIHLGNIIDSYKTTLSILFFGDENSSPYPQAKKEVLQLMTNQITYFS